MLTLFALLVAAFSRYARNSSAQAAGRPTRAAGRLLACLLALSCGSPVAGAADAAGATGWSSDLERSLRGAAQREQLVLLYLSSDRCKFCTQMVETTLAESELRRAIEDCFVPVAVNGSARPDLVRRLKVRAFPTTLVLDARGRVVKQVVGFQTAAKLWQQLGPHARLARGAAGAAADVAAAADAATQPPAPVVSAADLRTAESLGSKYDGASYDGDGPDGDRLPR